MAHLNLVHVGLNASLGCGTAVQSNGERMPLEKWIIEAYIRDTLSDPMLRRILDNAVRVEVA